MTKNTNKNHYKKLKTAKKFAFNPDPDQRMAIEKMLLDVLLRKSYQKKWQPLGITFEMKNRKLCAELKVYDFADINFEDIIESEVIHNWKERYNFLWEE